LASGYLRADSTRQHIAVLTEDWTVLCFDHRLRLVWESSLRPQLLDQRHSSTADGRTTTNEHDQHGNSGANTNAPHHAHTARNLHVATERPPSEATLLLSPVNVYSEDRGLVVVGARKQIRRVGGVLGHEHHRQHSSVGQRAFAGARVQYYQGLDYMPEIVPREVISAEQHFSFYALEGRTGARRWHHEEDDFQPDSQHKHEDQPVDQHEEHEPDSSAGEHGAQATEQTQSIMQAMLAGKAFHYDAHPDLSPDHSHKLHVLAQAHGAHLGEVSWNEYRQALFSALPSRWTSEKVVVGVCGECGVWGTFFFFFCLTFLTFNNAQSLGHQNGTCSFREETAPGPKRHFRSLRGRRWVCVLGCFFFQ
jgi:hypothetical protein